MAKRIVTYDANCGEADAMSMVGKVIHVYKSYAGALALDNTDFASVYDVDLLTGTVGTAVTQTLATSAVAAVGQDVNIHGAWVAGLDDDEDEYWLMCPGAGTWGAPRRLVIPRQDEASSSESSSSSSSSS